MAIDFGCDPIPGIAQLTPETAFLVVINGAKVNHSFPLNRLRSLIGRNHPPHIIVDIDLSDFESGKTPTISRHHAIIQWVNQKLQIADLASRNGTFVNGERLLPKSNHEPSDPVLLTIGSQIKLGDLELAIAKSP